MDEALSEALRVGFDHSIKLEFHGARVSSDGGLVTYRELDEELGGCHAGSVRMSGNTAAIRVRTKGRQRLNYA